MSDPSQQREERPLVPHPDDEAEVRAGFDEAERGEVLSESESAEYLRGLLAEPTTNQ